MLNVVFVILSLTLAVSCGDKGKKKSSNNLPVYNMYQQGQTMASSTEEGTFNLQTGVVAVSGRSFQPNQLAQQSQQYLQQFYYMVQQNPMGYQMVSQSTYRVRITGYLIETGNSQYPHVLTLTAPLQPY